MTRTSSLVSHSFRCYRTEVGLRHFTSLYTIFMIRLSIILHKKLSWSSDHGVFEVSQLQYELWSFCFYSFERFLTEFLLSISLKIFSNKDWMCKQYPSKTVLQCLPITNNQQSQKIGSYWIFKHCRLFSKETSCGLLSHRLLDLFCLLNDSFPTA